MAKPRREPPPRSRAADAAPIAATRVFTRRVIRYSLMAGLPLLLLPIFLPRKVHARRLVSRHTSAAGVRALHAATRAEREQQIQLIVDEFRRRLSIPDTVVASIVDRNTLVVSVARVAGPDRAFGLEIEEAFLETLDSDEIDAVIAHELGHVWIFTHHPFLHTEELANEIALRVVERSVLTGVYDKVWRRAGGKGDITYLP